MAQFTPDKEFFKKYYEGKRHKNYHKAVDIYYHITFHFDGYFVKALYGANGEATPDLSGVNPYFMRLIDQRRPTESAEILKYRRIQYLPVTKVPCNKVVSSLKKITKCADWKIDYSKSETPKILKEDQTLEQYCEKDFPKFDSIENWAYQNLIRWFLTDPNGIVCVMPLTWDVESSEFLSPFPHIIESRDVYDHKHDQYFVFLSPYVNIWTDSKGTEHEGKIIICVTKDAFYEYKQTGDGANDFILDTHPHSLGEIPCWFLGGVMTTPDINQPLYDSFISPILPSLDAAARDVSDLDAEKVQHLFSTQWVIQAQQCNACQGTGNVLAQGKQTVCPQCEGRGTGKLKPYDRIEYNPNQLDALGKQISPPFAGYVTKPTEMVKLMREEIQTEIYDALAAINMEFLCETPLNQSGKAKEVDRDELNNFVYGIAYHLIENNIKPAYYFINEMRYKLIIQSEEERLKMLPEIPVPENFDFLTVKDAEDKLVKISESKVSEGIKDAAEMSYIMGKYADQPDIRNRLCLIHDHDPLPAYNAEEIESLVQAGFVLKLDAVLNCYLENFVCTIMADKDESEKFMKLEFEKQKEILYGMAQDKLDELSEQSANEIMQKAEQADLNKKFDADGNQVDEMGQIIKTKEQLDAEVPAGRSSQRNALNNA